MMYLDLDEIDDVLALSKFWGRSRFCPARFRRDDYLKHEHLGLAESVRAVAEPQLGRPLTGPVRMLTHLRYFGCIFNPVTFYYCFDDANRLDAIVAQITNTPWNERHAYVLDARTSPQASSGALRWRFGKDFHVSPFLPMDLEYDWCFTPPGENLFVHMNLRDPADARKPFDATLRLHRRELSPARLRNILLRFPFMTARVITSIHWHALRLWLKRTPVFPHPRAAAAASESAS